MKNKAPVLLYKLLSPIHQSLGGLVLACMVLVLLLLLTVHITNAQSNILEVELEWPNEGETLYAGPSSLLYQVPIKGWITSPTFNPGEIEVTLDVFKGAAAIGRLKTIPDADGRFQFFITVNPNGSTEEFSIAFNDCGEQCHSPGDMDFQPGKLQLRVIATDPSGNQAYSERNITVDIAERATVPVTVRLADAPEQAVQHVPVTASTWIYLWRARFGHGLTDEVGDTAVQVEALSQSPTEYLFTVEPTVVDGILYEGIESVAVTLPPGATSAPPITLTVNAYTGTISGQLMGITDEMNNLSVWAIRLPAGESFQTHPSDQGFFTFSSVPIDRYLVVVDDDQVIENGIQSQPQSIDLFENREFDGDFPLTATAGSQLSGWILNDTHTALPFAWVTAEESGQTHSAALDSGTVVLNGLPSGSFPIIVSAPGYYSRKQLVDRSSGVLPDIDLILTQRPETQMLVWGAGAVVLPPETQADIENDTLILERGWLWGDNHAADPFVIQTRTAGITLSEGRFALIYLPGKQAWLYQFDGRSQIQSLNSPENITLQSGQMLNLLNDAVLQAVPFNPVVVAAMNPTTTPPISPTWEPTLSARVRNQLAQLGVNTAQIVTFITYFILLLSLLLIPIMAIYWQWKRKKTIRQNAWRQN